MGKKRVSVLGSEDESQIRAKKAVKLNQKKLREGREVKSDEAQAVPVEVKTPVESEIPTESQLTAKTPKSAPRSKAYLAAKSRLPEGQVYSIPDGLALLRKISLAKFDATVELHLILSDKAKGSSKTIDLPHSTGRVRRIAIADDETVAKIEAGQIDFDVLLASPAQMAKLIRLAKTLGPKGLMPNPKNGTVVDNPEAAAQKLAQAATVTLKTDKNAPIIHTSVGKLSMPDTYLSENITAVLKPFTSDLKKVVLKSSMSPAIKLHPLEN